jgi:hypothetical protein
MLKSGTKVKLKKEFAYLEPSLGLKKDSIFTITSESSIAHSYLVKECKYYFFGFELDILGLPFAKETVIVRLP